MNNIHEWMKSLQQISEQLSKMNIDQASPWQSINQMQDMFNGDFWKRMTEIVPLHQEKAEGQPHQKTQEAAAEFTPPIDIFQTLGKIIVSCEIPGLDYNSLKISVTNESQFIVQGKIKVHDLVDYLVKEERIKGKFKRQVSLPCRVSANGMKTSYKDGVLEIHLNRHQEAFEKGR